MSRAAVVLLSLAACGSPQDDLADGVFVLPRQLREVSGIVAVDQHTLVCVQDEAGALFFVDLLGHIPIRREVFGPPGDYEGLAFAGGDYWVLRADGVVLRVGSKSGEFGVSGTIRLPADHSEWEALTSDGAGLLLAMPKDATKGPGERHLRRVFGVDVATGTVLPEPVVTIDTRTLLEQATAHGIDLPVRVSSKGNQRLDLRLACSEVLALPGSRDLLLLSPADHALIRVDRRGVPLGFRALDPRELPQPEGLALLPDGLLLVASEGPSAGVVRVVPMP